MSEDGPRSSSYCRPGIFSVALLGVSAQSPSFVWHRYLFGVPDGAQSKRSHQHWLFPSGSDRDTRESNVPQANMRQLGSSTCDQSMKRKYCARKRTMSRGELKKFHDVYNCNLQAHTCVLLCACVFSIARLPALIGESCIDKPHNSTAQVSLTWSSDRI